MMEKHGGSLAELTEEEVRQIVEEVHKNVGIRADLGNVLKVTRKFSSKPSKCYWDIDENCLDTPGKAIGIAAKLASEGKIRQSDAPAIIVCVDYAAKKAQEIVPTIDLDDDELL